MSTSINSNTTWGGKDVPFDKRTKLTKQLDITFNREALLQLIEQSGRVRCKTQVVDNNCDAYKF